MPPPLSVDLHSHSTCSDGSDTPSELIQRAHAAGINVFALTDHDTLAGVGQARQTAQACGMTLVSGVEISCQHVLSGGYGKHKAADKIIHVLGLAVQDETRLSEHLAAIQQSRAERGHAIVKQLATLLPTDQDDLWQQVLAKTGGDAQAVGRAHIAQVLHAGGWVPTVQKAFDKYLADNKPAYVPIETIRMAQTVALIHECGGKAVLAHPTRYKLSATRVRRLIADFAQMDGDACELPADSEPVSTRRMIDRCVAEHELLVSAGSDYHGRSMPWRRLGDVPTPTDEQRGVWEGIA